ncbi:hypothetical protein SLA2020_271530 [Shorea laevis]
MEILIKSYEPPNDSILLAITNISQIIRIFLKIIDDVPVELKGLGENIRIDGSIRSKDCICYGDEPRILATDTGKDNSIGMPWIKLEVVRPIGKTKTSPRLELW